MFGLFSSTLSSFLPPKASVAFSFRLERKLAFSEGFDFIFFLSLFLHFQRKGALLLSFEENAGLVKGASKASKVSSFSPSKALKPLKALFGHHLQVVDPSSSCRKTACYLSLGGCFSGGNSRPTEVRLLASSVTWTHLCLCL